MRDGAENNMLSGAGDSEKEPLKPSREPHNNGSLHLLSSPYELAAIILHCTLF